MTKVYKEAGGHKKLLVPVVALLLCAFAMVGAGYAFLASTASSSGNSLDGDVITVKLGDENSGWGWVTVKDTIDYGYYFDYDSETEELEEFFFIGENPIKLRTGTLNIDLSEYSGTKIKIAKAVLDDLGEGNSLKGTTEVNIVFLNGSDEAIDIFNNAFEFESDDYEDYFDNTSKVLSINFKVEITFTEGDEFEEVSLDENGVKSKTEGYKLAEGTKLQDLADGFTYNVLFTVHPVDDSP